MSEEQPKKQEVKEEPAKAEQLKNELTEDELKGVRGGSSATEQSVNNWIDEEFIFLTHQHKAREAIILLVLNLYSLYFMSEERLKAFLEKVKGDTSLQEKLNAPTTPEAVIEIAKEAGFSITAEDIQSIQSQSGEVSDDELVGATGGLVEVTLRPLRLQLPTVTLGYSQQVQAYAKDAQLSRACTDH